jgi:hypothetical protein
MQAGRPGFRLEVTGLPAPIAARSIVESSMPSVQPCIVRGFAMYDYECVRSIPTHTSVPPFRYNQWW